VTGATGATGTTGATGATGPVDFLGSANIAFSRDDISGWTTAFSSGADDNVSNVGLGFSVTIQGVSYSTVDICTNGFLQFGSQGVSWLGNGTLPSSLFTNPAICWYWDDLVVTGNGVRYTSQGSAPNRVFIVDYETQTYSGSYGVTAQIQIHETSNLVNIRYYTTNPSACGQSATIGIQGAGGGSASAFPISYNTKVLDDNFNPESISFTMPK
jgi:hypothetical protein